MTISTLCRGRSTLDQLDILQRADADAKIRFGYGALSGPLGKGRYYGGPLTDAQVATLDPPKSPRKAPQQVPRQDAQPE